MCALLSLRAVVAVSLHTEVAHRQERIAAVVQPIVVVIAVVHPIVALLQVAEVHRIAVVLVAAHHTVEARHTVAVAETHVADSVLKVLDQLLNN